MDVAAPAIAAAQRRAARRDIEAAREAIGEIAGAALSETGAQADQVVDRRPGQPRPARRGIGARDQVDEAELAMQVLLVPEPCSAKA